MSLQANVVARLPRVEASVKVGAQTHPFRATCGLSQVGDMPDNVIQRCAARGPQVLRIKADP